MSLPGAHRALSPAVTSVWRCVPFPALAVILLPGRKKAPLTIVLLCNAVISLRAAKGGRLWGSGRTSHARVPLPSASRSGPQLMK